MESLKLDCEIVIPLSLEEAKHETAAGSILSMKRKEDYMDKEIAFFKCNYISLVSTFNMYIFSVLFVVGIWQNVVNGFGIKTRKMNDRSCLLG